jgi:hypothetical protein
MFNTRIFRLRHFAALLLALIFAVSAYAFAAANTVPSSGAGDGSATISGYTITNVTYDTNTDSNPGTIDQVSFDLTPNAGAGAATEVYVKLVNAGGSWYTCSAGAVLDWDCTIGGAVTTLAADELRVVAAQ